MMKNSFVAMLIVSTALLNSCNNAAPAPAPQPKKAEVKKPVKKELTMLQKKQLELKEKKEAEALAEKQRIEDEKKAFELAAKKKRDAHAALMKKYNSPEGLAFKKSNPFLATMLPNLKNYDGTPFDIDDAVSGGPVMVYYSASWCGPCRAVTPQLVKQIQKFKKMGINLVLAGADRSEADMIKYMQHYNMPWPGISREFHGNTKINSFASRGIPHIALVSANGQLIAKGHPSGLNQMLSKLP